MKFYYTFIIVILMLISCERDEYGDWSEYDNEIYRDRKITYTTTDDRHVDFRASEYFEDEIVAHYYKDGYGTIIFSNNVIDIRAASFKDCKTLVTINIPTCFNIIGDSAFYGCQNLISVTIGDHVTTIGEEAFAYCTRLTSVTIPASLTTIGDYAFNRCDNLTNVYITDLSAWLSIDGSLHADNLYLKGKLVTNLVIPSSVTAIKELAFSGCNSLESVSIPDSVTTIGYAAFKDCANLTSISIGYRVTTIGNRAFAYCDKLPSVTIGDSVTTIGNDAFYMCKSLTSVYCKATTPPAGGSDMFDGNASGRKIYVPAESVKAYKSAEYWSNYADYIVGYDFEADDEVNYQHREICYTATERIVKAWTFEAFGANIVSHEWDYAMNEGVITFDADVTTIGKYAFSYCYSLTSVTIPDSVTTIGNSAFYSCDSLTSVTIPDSVTTIGYRAFYDCYNLTSVTIPDSVTTIGEEAFSDCYSLTSVYCKAITPPAGGYDMFYSNASDRKIYVPSTSVDAYKSAAYWSKYANSIVGYDFQNGEVVE